MSERVKLAGLDVARSLADFINDEALPGSNVPPAQFWSGFRLIVDAVTPTNQALLAERDRIQRDIDAWHRDGGDPTDLPAYRTFLTDIGYLLPEPADFTVTTENVDPEIAEIAGPQLIVPVLNARFALNAANARWGSLYDALYGTDAIAGPPPAQPGYDPARGAQVIAWTKRWLDSTFPLAGASYADVSGFAVADGQLVASLAWGGTSALREPERLRGYRGDPAAPRSILLRNHGLHAELVIDPDTEVGRGDPAGLSDVVLESAVTTIVDFEDAVAAVDADDKVIGYRHWLGLNKGDLSASFTKGGKEMTRALNDDRVFTAADGETLTLPGRALMLVRNVGHHMMTDAVLDPAGREIGEGILDAAVTALCALPGLTPGNARGNGRTGSIYIVKPKMHGPAEVALTVDLFTRVEQLLGLPERTIKLGLMDEERRTSVNLRSSILVGRDRLVFINTGFLDRSGDEIHTSTQAGPIVRKADLRTSEWMGAYEALNVDAGLAAGLPGHAQIGKGMWAMTERMADMLAQKGGQPRAGASTAWVPSPTAATLHALHYHEVDVAAVQDKLVGSRHATLDELLRVPLGDPASWSAADRQRELDNNAQSLLGYVVRWIDQGVGCSKVPDIDGVDLMEDRATLRISSQLLANWLRHGIIDSDQVVETFRRVAGIVDDQNAGDPAYHRMTGDFDSNIAFQAALDLVLHGIEQPNGYTEPILHRRRREFKAAKG